MFRSAVLRPLTQLRELAFGFGGLAVLLGGLAIAGPAYASPVALRAADGASLSADHAGKGDRGVVLVHGMGGSRGDWESFVKRLEEVQVVAVDLRGHGASKGDVDAAASVGDVAAAVAFLRARGVKKVSVMGVGLGGNLALAAAAADPTIESVVMISPALNANGVKASASLEAIGTRPLLLVAGADDPLSTKAANLIADNASGARVEIAPAGGSGIALVHRAADLEGSLVAWVRGAYAVAGGDLTPQTRTDATPGDIETTGTRIGEKRP